MHIYLGDHMHRPVCVYLWGECIHIRVQAWKGDVPGIDVYGGVCPSVPFEAPVTASHRGSSLQNVLRRVYRSLNLNAF